MKQNGKILPAKIGPVPSENRVNAGICNSRMGEQNPERQQEHHAQLDECAQIIARRKQQPNRQSARQESIDDDGERERDAAPT